MPLASLVLLAAVAALHLDRPGLAAGLALAVPVLAAAYFPGDSTAPGPARFPRRIPRLIAHLLAVHVGAPRDSAVGLMLAVAVAYFLTRGVTPRSSSQTQAPSSASGAEEVPRAHRGRPRDPMIGGGR